MTTQGPPPTRLAGATTLGSAGGGVLMDMLHIVYLAEALLGASIERVSGWVTCRELECAGRGHRPCPVRDRRAPRLW